VGAQNTVGLGVGDDLHEAVSVGIRAGPAVGGKGEVADAVLYAGLLQLVLGLAHPGDLRVCVHNGGDGVVVDVSVAASELLRHRDTLLLGLVCEHGSDHHVADREDVALVGLEVSVDLNATTLVNLHTNLLQVEKKEKKVSKKKKKEEKGNVESGNKPSGQAQQ